jgi:hypothetical protein
VIIVVLHTHCHHYHGSDRVVIGNATARLYTLVCSRSTEIHTHFPEALKLLGLLQKDSTLSRIAITDDRITVDTREGLFITNR